MPERLAPIPRDAFELRPGAGERVREWFADAGLGLFIHWDHASVAGRELSWPMVGGIADLPGASTSTVAEYQETADRFDPKRWDPDALAELAWRAGFRYVVFTARHHAGWSAWPSRVGAMGITTSPFGARGGDLVRDITQSFRKRGLRVGLYYSLSDWSHPSYPAWQDSMRPYDVTHYPFPSKEQWAEYREYLRTQLTELLTGYGHIDLLWFDGEFERTIDEWGTAELRRLIHSLQPGTLINDRLLGCGDFRTPEQFIPAVPSVDPWEACMTMNASWAHVPDDTDYKSIHEIIRTLCETVGRGGNLLLNVGPTASGELPEVQRRRLEELGDWMKVNAEAIHGCSAGLDAWQADGPTSRRDDRLYLFLTSQPVESVVVRGVPVDEIQSVRLLGSSTPLPFRTRRRMQGVDPHPVREGELIILVDRPGGTVPVIEVTFRSGTGAVAPSSV